ncbi:MAG: multidrug effflux MFS transporter [Pseudomonadota bacterium]
MPSHADQEAAVTADGPTAAAELSETPPSLALLAVLICITGLGPLAMSSFIPAIPAIQADFDVSTTVSQLTLSVSMLFMAVGSLIYGALSDRIGRRPVLLGGVTLGIIGSVICALGPNIWLVILGRALQAAGCTVGFVLSRVVVQDVYGEWRASSLLGYISAAMMIAPVLGPFLGGYLIEYLHWRYIFVVIAVIAALVWIGIYRVLPETRPAGVTGDPQLVPWRRFGKLLQRRPYRRMVIYGSALQCAFMGFLSGAPYLLTRYYNLPASSYGWYFVGVPLGFFFGSLIAGRLGQVADPRTLVYWGAVGSMVSCAAALLLTAGIPIGPWGLFAPAAFMSLAQASAYPGLQIRLLRASAPHAGSGSGCFSAIQLLASGLVAQLVGLTLAWGPIGVTGAMTLCASVALLIVLTRSKTQPAEA